MKASLAAEAVDHVASPLARRRFLVIHNPVAGARRGRHLRAVIERLIGAHGAEVEVRATTGRGDAEAIARSVLPGTVDAVVAAGGDGTINEVINGLAARGDSGAAAPLGLVPLGTANVLANELRLPFGTDGIADALVFGPSRVVNLGVANGRCFSMMAGVGLDAQVVESVDPGLKRMTGKVAYAVETLSQLIRQRNRRYTVTIGGQSWEVASVVVANGRFYGGRFVCAREASLFQRRLDVCLFPGMGRWNAVRYLWGVLAGRLEHFRDYRIVPADRVFIDGPPGECVQGDGDTIARLPVEMSVSPWRLPMIVAPAAGSAQLP